MSEQQLKERMREFINTDYKAYLFLENDNMIGYALVNMKQSPKYLRQFFMCRGKRKKGYGTKALSRLLEILDVEAIDLEVLSWNQPGISFWKSLGFKERSIYMRYIR